MCWVTLTFIIFESASCEFNGNVLGFLMESVVSWRCIIGTSKGGNQCDINAILVKTLTDLGPIITSNLTLG